MAATRLPLGQTQPQPDQRLLDLLTAPGSTGAFRSPNRNNPYMDLMGVVNRGNPNLGVGGLQSYFQNGLLSDPQGLVRLLNVSALRPQYFTGGGGGFNPLGGALGGLGGGVIGGLVGGLFGGGGSNAPNLGRASGPYAGNLNAWLDQLHQTYGFNRRYDPSSLAYTGPQIAPDLTLQRGATSLDQLNQWAQQNYGVDFATFAAMSPNLRNTRQAYSGDPSRWFNPQAPGVAATTRIPGLGQADSALRLQQYSEAYDNMLRERAQRGAANQAGLTANALQANPALSRTAYGRSQGVQGPQQANLSNAAAGTPGANPDYSFALQQALFPMLMQQYLGTIV